MFRITRSSLHDLVVLGDAGADQLGVVFADEGDVEVLVVVGKVGGGRLADGHAVARHVLAEIGDHEFGLARRCR